VLLYRYLRYQPIVLYHHHLHQKRFFLKLRQYLTKAIQEQQDIIEGNANEFDTQIGSVNGQLSDLNFGYDDVNERLVFNLNGVSESKVVIDNGGNIGIGTTSPISPLEIISTDTTNGLFRLAYDEDNYTKFTLATDGAMTINESGTDLATFSETGVNFDVPTSFNATEGVDIAYNLQFTNETASYVKSAGPLYIESGENDNLTLTTYGTGDIVMNLAIGTTSANAVLPGTDDVHDLGSADFRWDDIYSTNGTIQTADAQVQEHIADMDYGLDELLQMRPVTFSWISHPEKVQN